MLNRRAFGKFIGAAAAGAGLWSVFIGCAMVPGGGSPPTRGTYLIKGGAVITVDPTLGVLPQADILVRAGRIEAIGADLAASSAGAEVIDATDMIVMPGFIDTHYHLWSALGRNFIGDRGFGYPSRGRKDCDKNQSLSLARIMS